MLRMLATGRILLYRNPDPKYPEDNWYISVGSVTEERVSPDHRISYRKWTVEVVVVDRPVGALMSVKSNRTYETYMTKEPDGINPIAPNQYGSPSDSGAVTDYSDYVHVLIGGASAEVRGGRRSAAGSSLTYGNSEYPTIQAAHTSWSLL